MKRIYEYTDKPTDKQYTYITYSDNTNHQRQKENETDIYIYTNTQIYQHINNADKHTNRWTTSHGSACHL